MNSIIKQLLIYYIIIKGFFPDARLYFNSNSRKFLCIPQLQIVLDYKSGLNPSNKNTQNPWSETRISKVNKKNTCIGLNGILSAYLGIFDLCEESLFYVGYVMSALIAVRGVYWEECSVKKHNQTRFYCIIEVIRRYLRDLCTVRTSVYLGFVYFFQWSFVL